MAPVDKFDENGKMRVYLNVTDLLVEEIKFVQSEFLVRFTLHMSWRDERLTFLNLHKGRKNLIPLHEISEYILFYFKYVHIIFSTYYGIIAI